MVNSIFHLIIRIFIIHMWIFVSISDHIKHMLLFYSNLFSDASAVVTNCFLRYSLANASHTICVSHTGKENTVLR